MRTEEMDVVVIGGGPAGMAAAAAASDEGAERLLLVERGDALGGILNQCIHDGFGTKIFGEALTGPEYAQIYIDRLEKAKVSCSMNSMVLDLNEDGELTVLSESGMRRIRAKSVVLSMGCRERSRGAIRIPGSRPAGVFTAGVVQYYMNERNITVGRKAVILGSGDIGLIMARRLTLEGAKVACVAEILPYPSGIARNIVQCLEDFDIPLRLSTTVVEIHGTDRLTGVTLARVGPKGGIVPGTKEYIECDTLLLSVGLIPENELAKKAGVNINPVTNGPVVDDSFQTSVPGIFSAGNCLQVHDLVDYASLEAERAGKCAAIYAAKGSLPIPTIKVTPGKDIRYVVPQSINGLETVDFAMRVRSPDKNRYVVIRRNGEVVRKLRQLLVEPSAMIRVRVRADRFQGGSGDLKVELE